MPAYIVKAACILTLINIAACATAQEKTIKKNNQQWLQYYTQIKLNDKWTLLADGGYRVANNFGTSSQYLIRAGLGYTLNPNIQVGGGFAHFGFYTSGKLSRVEFRPYEELMIKSKLGNTDISNRVRVEERFFNPVVEGSIKGPGTFNVRFRYQLVANIPLINLSEKDPNKKILLGIGDEVFLNAGKHIVYNVFDQNRLLISPTVQFSKNLSVALTWNSQFGATNTPATYNYSKILWLQVRQKFNGAGKKTKQ